MLAMINVNFVRPSRRGYAMSWQGCAAKLTSPLRPQGCFVAYVWLICGTSDGADALIDSQKPHGDQGPVGMIRN